MSSTISISSTRDKDFLRKAFARMGLKDFSKEKSPGDTRRTRSHESEPKTANITP